MIEILDFKDETLPLKVRRTAFVLDFLNHFTSENRGIHKNLCSYEHGCAIGRFLPKDYARELDIRENTYGWKEPLNNDPRTPNWLRSLGHEFLLEVQKIHDGRKNFDEYGAFKKTCFWLSDSEVDLSLIKSKLEEINLKRISND